MCINDNIKKYFKIINILIDSWLNHGKFVPLLEYVETDTVENILKYIYILSEIIHSFSLTLQIFIMSYLFLTCFCWSCPLILDSLMAKNPTVIQSSIHCLFYFAWQTIFADYIFVTAAMKLKYACSFDGKLWKNKFCFLCTLKSRDITLLIKIHTVKAMVFPLVMYGCQSWTIKKAEHQRIDAFEL